jgi:hypothetical protein
MGIGDFGVISATRKFGALLVGRIVTIEAEKNN